LTIDGTHVTKPFCNTVTHGKKCGIPWQILCASPIIHHHSAQYKFCDIYDFCLLQVDAAK